MLFCSFCLLPYDICQIIWIYISIRIYIYSWNNTSHKISVAYVTKLCINLYMHTCMCVCVMCIHTYAYTHICLFPFSLLSIPSHPQTSYMMSFFLWKHTFSLFPIVKFFLLLSPVNICHLFIKGDNKYTVLYTVLGCQSFSFNTFEF